MCSAISWFHSMPWHLISPVWEQPTLCTYQLQIEYFFISDPLPSCSWPFLTLTLCVYLVASMRLQPLEVGAGKGVPPLWSGGQWPTHPSPLRARAEEPQHTFSIYQPCNELLLPTSCARDMSRGEEQRSHDAGLRSPATNRHHICGGSPTACRMDSSDSANSLPLTKALTKGTPMHLLQLVQVCNPSQSSPIQGSHFLHNSWKTYSLEKWSNSSEQCRTQFMLKNPKKSPAYKGMLKPAASENFKSIT